MGSRRNPRDKPTGEVFPVVDLICTDRGQHSPVTVRVLDDQRGTDPPGQIVASHVTSRISSRGRKIVHDQSATPALSIIRTDGSRTFTFPCAGCARNWQVRGEKLAVILDRLYAAYPHDWPHYLLDMSYAQ